MTRNALRSFSLSKQRNNRSQYVTKLIWNIQKTTKNTKDYK